MRVASNIAISLLNAAARPAIAMFYYPNPAASALEHILVDNWGAYASNFSSAITPCDNYVTEVGLPAINSRRTTSAQWLRVAFHDFATADIAAGTGGLDASIGFETGREENSGSAFNDSFTFWKPFVNEFVPMADLLAIGTVMSVHLCGGKYIPYQYGRVDATTADPKTGVPEPSTSVEDTLSQFKKAGFNQSDAIALTACGHTIGSVHSGGFPTVVEGSAITPNNTNGAVNLDGTRAVFDSAVVHEYIDGTGQRGGPLVTSFNETSRSDLRLYESDRNKTMLELYAQGDEFQDTCVDLLGRMLNTVPAAVQLQPAIEPALIKPINVTWDITSDNKLVLTGKIRVLYTGAVSDDPISITFSNGYTETLVPEENLGISAFKLSNSQTNATTQYSHFSISSGNVSGASSFAVVAMGIETQVFQIQDKAFVVPSLTQVADRTVSITVAARNNQINFDPSQMSLKVATPIAQPLTLAPKIVRSDVQLEEGSSPLDNVGYWSGSVAIGNPIGSVSVSLLFGEDVIDTLLLDAGVAGW
ncbi:heme peroxidase [Annulohypoxylon maeteangense]|uniref:heme peroxidase n=1 Tax=Annulohypoxylon maeteangense TaxID=1927788 RepID=UPI0020084122|nr:heme peroxidase [Annulohypoxylon maeteangense]KAI0880494.1 heme peroxidase [Annulohypoxylon maeteangense]